MNCRRRLIPVLANRLCLVASGAAILLATPWIGIAQTEESAKEGKEVDHAEAVMLEAAQRAEVQANSQKLDELARQLEAQQKAMEQQRKMFEAQMGAREKEYRAYLKSFEAQQAQQKQQTYQPAQQHSNRRSQKLVRRCIRQATGTQICY